MLEILKFILTLCQEIAKLASNGEKKRFREMGKQLLLIYMYMNDVVVSACKILEQFERGVECVDFRMARWGESYETAAGICKFAQIDRLTREHSVFLSRLWGAIIGFEVEFAILDADTHRKLAALVHEKIGVISAYLSHLESGKWLVITEDVEFSEEIDNMLYLETILKMGKNFIDTSLERNNYELIKSYIKSGNPLKQIRELDQLRENVKGIVEKYWNVADLLPDTKNKYLRYLKEENQ